MDYYITQKNLAIKTGEWLAKIASFNTHTMQLESSRAALLIIDMQKYFLDPKSPTFTCGGPAILPNIKELIKGFRKAGRPVIYTKHVHHPDFIDAGIMKWWWEGACLEGSPESEIDDDIAPLPNEKIILKHRYSAFYNTDLETILRCLKIEDLVVAGIMTNICCESTARDAYYRDYRVFFPADATGSINEEMHLATLLNLAFGFAYITRTADLIDSLKIP
ncbi:MAG: cysteine hydrolase [candidate division Zixibacteria bacterium]|nr:cysteine hydrolase [candidate division Zixibacteria bacterium]